jgi:ADP-ribose pyrophosphatase
MGFAESYLGQLRAAVGHRPLLVIGVRVMVEDAQGRVLILRRSDTGDWGLPAGAMELGESLEDAMRREVLEETNLALGPLEVFGISSDPATEHFTYPNGDQVQTVSVLARAALEGGVPGSNDGEAEDFRFVDPAEVRPEEFTRPEYPTLLAYARWRAGGGFQFF